MSEITLQDVERLLDAKLSDIVERLEEKLDDIEAALTDTTCLNTEAADGLIDHREILDTHSAALHQIQEAQDSHTTMLAVLAKQLKDGRADIMAWRTRLEHTDVALKYIRKKLKLRTKKYRRRLV